MSYCVNCGVELHDSAAECPLCNTIVYNPNAVAFDHVTTPFPVEHGEVEEVKRKDIGILVTVVLASIALTSGLLNQFAYNSVLWSFPIIGACFVIWVMCLPFFLKSFGFIILLQFFPLPPQCALLLLFKLSFKV